MTPDLVLIGGGEHAAIVAEIARLTDRSIRGYVAPNRTPGESDLSYLGGDSRLTEHTDAEWIIAIGAVGPPRLRRRVARQVDGFGSFATLIHPSAFVSASASVGPGSLVGAAAVVQPRASLGSHVIVGTGAIVEHDVVLADHVVLGPGVTIGGGSSVGEGSFIGLGASIRDHVEIGDEVTVGMGSLVVRAVQSGASVMGAPAGRVDGDDGAG